MVTSVTSFPQFHTKADFIKTETQTVVFKKSSSLLSIAHLYASFHCGLIQCVWNIWVHIVKSLLQFDFPVLYWLSLLHCALLMSICNLSSSLPLNCVSFSYPQLYFHAHLYYYFNYLWIYINSTSEHVSAHFLSHLFLYSVLCSVSSQDLISRNYTLLLSFPFELI